MGDAGETEEGRGGRRKEGRNRANERAREGVRRLE